MSAREKKSGATKLKQILGVVLFGGLVFLVWASAWYVLAAAPEPKGLDGKPLSLVDRTTINLGALAITVGLLTVVIGGIAVIGWDKLEKIIRRDVEDSLRGRIDLLEIQLRGRAYAVLGYLEARVSAKPAELRASDPDLLDEALWYCQKSYDLLKQVGGPPMLMALNNLVYYSCVRGDKPQGRQLLEQARLLRNAGDEYGSPTLLLTYCRAVVEYSKDKADIAAAREIAKSLLVPEISPVQQREARLYLTSLPQEASESVRS
jgi:hypothetical protein